MMRSYEVITPAIIPNFDLVTYLLGAWFGFRDSFSGFRKPEDLLEILGIQNQVFPRFWKNMTHETWVTQNSGPMPTTAKSFFFEKTVDLMRPGKVKIGKPRTMS